MSSPDKRFAPYRPEPIGRMLQSMFRAAPGARRARAMAALKRDWADVAGPEFAAVAFPDRFEPGRNGRPGALALRAAPGAGLILQHDAPRLVERINAFLGADAVGRIKIVSGGLPEKASAVSAARAPRLAADSARAMEIAARAESVSSPRLAEALKRLGAAVGDRGRSS